MIPKAFIPTLLTLRSNSDRRSSLEMVRPSERRRGSALLMPQGLPLPPGVLKLPPGVPLSLSPLSPLRSFNCELVMVQIVLLPLILAGNLGFS